MDRTTYSRPTVRLDVRVDPDLRRAAAMAAAARGVSLSAAVRESLRAYIDSTAALNAQRPQVSGGADGCTQPTVPATIQESSEREPD